MNAAPRIIVYLLKAALAPTLWLLRVLVFNRDLPPVGRRVVNLRYGPLPEHRLDAYVPQGEGPFPILVFVHGGGWIAGNKEMYARICRWFAARGYVVFSITYRLAPRHKYAAMSAEDRRYYNQARQPLMVFPDISMWGNHPGMLVNKDYWKLLQAELNDYSPELMKGGWPYSERWNADLASVMFLSWFWNPKKPVETVLDGYASFYFGPEAGTGRRLLDLLDDGNKDPDRKEKIRETLAKLESSLPEWVKRDWRWEEIVTSCNRFK